jgi:alkanesulfonate monooxygenase SsuD/methylene tetrahydromethanopterin reductase-like flavin-dependent oxidoreductase (luciferase family)
VQKPYPPILMGGAGPHARQRAVDFDGHWIPIGGRAYSEPIAESMADFRARGQKAGRDPATLTVSIFGAAPDEAKLSTLRDAGVTRAVFFVPSATGDVVLPLLDQYADLAKKVG